MMFGSRVRYGITYKTNQKAFTVYRRKFEHDFRVPISAENLEGSMGLDLPKHNALLVTKVDKIYLYDSRDFSTIGQIPINLLKTETREPNQIISMTKSPDEELIAVMSGKNLIMKQQKVNQLFVFEKKSRDPEPIKYELKKRIIVKDIPLMNKVCMQYYFELFDKDGRKKQEIDSLIFVKADRVIRMNIETEFIDTLYDFKENGLKRQPEFFQMNDK